MGVTAAILTVSDRCSKGKAEDKSGQVLEEMARGAGWAVAARAVVPDDKRRIAAHVRSWTDRKRISLILSTGGTGLSPRDVTPEAIRPLLTKEIPGFSELMRAEGLKHTPMAALSRSLAGARGRSLILCLPGSPKGARESLEAVMGLVPHALSILAGGGHD